MVIVWTAEALRRREATFRYIYNCFGYNSARNFQSDIVRVQKILMQNPAIAPIEELLEGSSVEFRSIVLDTINRIVYYIQDENIIISDIWDMRQAPENLVSRTKR